MSGWMSNGIGGVRLDEKGYMGGVRLNEKVYGRCQVR